MTRSSSAAAFAQQQPAPFPWMLSRTAFHALQDKPVSSFSDHDVDLTIDLHLQRNALGVYRSLTNAKGIRKAIEKLHDDEAWDKYVEYETVLKSFRKGERRVE